MQVYKNNVFWFETTDSYEQILQLPQVVAFNDECIANGHIMACWVDGDKMYLDEV